MTKVYEMKWNVAQVCSVSIAARVEILIFHSDNFG